VRTVAERLPPFFVENGKFAKKMNRVAGKDFILDGII
jgi:hypothetical protein